jgi:hypothetical protein
MNNIWILQVVTEYNYLNDLANEVYAFASKEDAETYRKQLIDCFILDVMESVGCTEEEIPDFLEIEESEIFNTIYLEYEDLVELYFEVKEIPIMRFEEA